MIVLLLLLLTPQADPAARVKALVAALGEDDPALREAAEKELLGLGSGAREALEAHADHADAEVRARVRTILQDVRFLPVEAILLPALVKFGSPSPEQMQAGAEELLKADRGKVKEALKVCVERGAETLRFRAKQLTQVLWPGGELQVGTVLGREFYAAGEPVRGLEILLNDTDKDLVLAGTAHTDLVCLQPAELTLQVRLFVPALKSFTLKAHSARVLEYDLRRGEDSSGPGKYHLRLTFNSTKDYVEDAEDRKKVFQATLTSEGSDFHVR